MATFSPFSRGRAECDAFVRAMHGASFANPSPDTEEGRDPKRQHTAPSVDDDEATQYDEEATQCSTLSADEPDERAVDFAPACAIEGAAAAPAAAPAAAHAAAPAAAAPAAASSTGPSAPSCAAAPSPPRPAPHALVDKSRNGWVGQNREKWTCAADCAPTVHPTNLWLSEEFDRLAGAYKAMAGQEWRKYNFSKAAKIIRSLDFELTRRDCAAQLKPIKGMGERNILKVRELLETGGLSRLEMMSSCESVAARRALCKVHGVGGKIAAEWFARGIRSVDEAVRAGVMNAQQLVGAKHWRDLEERIPRAECSAIIEAVRTALRAVLRASGVAEGELERAADAVGAGSYRRGKPSSGDVDVLICRRDGLPVERLLEDVIRELGASCELDHLTHADETHRAGLNKTTVVSVSHSYRGVIRLPGLPTFRRIDVKVYRPHEYAYALLYFTGSDHFNRSMRHYAKSLGYSLSDHGLVHATKRGAHNIVRGVHNLVPAESEEEIFDALGLPYRAPSERNCEVQAPVLPRLGCADGAGAARTLPPPSAPAGAAGWGDDASSSCADERSDPGSDCLEAIDSEDEDWEWAPADRAAAGPARNGLALSN